MFLISNPTGDTIVARADKVAIPGVPSSRSCLSEAELSNELHKLSFAESYAEQAKIVDLLIRDARKSLLCRKEIISGLMKAMDKPNLDLERDRASFYLWHYGSKILANLKATEALDFLIAHLDLHDGVVFPLNHHPAMNAVVKIGKVAIPNLDAALRKSSEPYLRRLIVFCMGWLGGPTARKNIEEALAVETDACVRSFMRSTLMALNNRQQPNQITSSDRLKWYGSFRCNVQ